MGVLLVSSVILIYVETNGNGGSGYAVEAMDAARESPMYSSEDIP